ncbi:N-acetylglucosamine-6-phosphate deacetylase isoform X1 [Ctenocephalides felis]|uniref:N-acetylglucosamine-6-phosphate deacetylase isoform X1 n=1 Tax=Ctenocephalides felis TaxID=7515 RepID=UPI000E6E48DB|nr:N-acetylglucosamine-6-phosphate deacetylase isoform X1 [Ctenocephalides felis]
MHASKIIQFKNCYILRDHNIILEDLWIRNGKIINPEDIFFDEKTVAHEVIDCKGAIISPGFIDIQINGGFGIDFSNNTSSVEAGIEKVSKGILAHGVTSFCPTIVTSPTEIYHKIIPKILKRKGGKHGATVLGIHLEGPYINKKKKGAHPEKYIMEFDQEYKQFETTYGAMENVSIITVAPEKENAMKMISMLTKNGLVVSLGHSTANLVEGEQAVKAGATLITHLFNAMLPFHHRDPGLVGLLSTDSFTNDKTIYFGLISDGVHTHPAALRIAYKTHPNGLILVTDAISALGLHEGTHNIGQLSVQITGSRAYIAGTDTLCGSICSMNECIKFFLEATGCSMAYALEVASLHPAKAIGISNVKGSLDYDRDADLVFLDKNFNVLSTWISGKMVYSAN